MKAKAIMLGLVTWFTVVAIVGGSSGLLLPALSPDARDAFIPMLFGIGLAGGVLSSFLGGYVAGRVAKSAELTHAAVIGAVIAVLRFGLSFVIHSHHPRPLGESLAIAGFGFACAVFGGWLANWRNEKSNQAVELTAARLRGQR